MVLRQGRYQSQLLLVCFAEPLEDAEASAAQGLGEAALRCHKYGMRGRLVRRIL
jgi:hypothetical protein